MPKYSQVTKTPEFEKGQYLNLKEVGQDSSGWYVGAGLYKSKLYGNTYCTVHLLQPNGNILGVNLTQGQTKQFVEGKIIAQDLLGKFITLAAVELIPVKRGNFLVLKGEAVDPPADMPEINFDLVPVVDYTDFEPTKTEAKKLDVVKPQMGDVPVQDTLAATQVSTGVQENTEDFEKLFNS